MPEILLAGEDRLPPSRLLIVCRTDSEEALSAYLEEAIACCWSLKALPIMLSLAWTEAVAHRHKVLSQKALSHIGLTGEIDLLSGAANLMSLLAIARCRRCELVVLPTTAFPAIAATYPTLSARTWWRQAGRSLLFLNGSSCSCGNLGTSKPPSSPGTHAGPGAEP